MRMRMAGITLTVPGRADCAHQRRINEVAG